MLAGIEDLITAALLIAAIVAILAQEMRVQQLRSELNSANRMIEIQRDARKRQSDHG